MIWFFFGKKLFKRKNRNQLQSHVMLNRVEKVFKLVLAEGFFSEIVDFKNENKKLFGLVSSTKKSLLIVDAKVLIGFDFKKVKMEIDERSRSIKFTHLPQPEVLSMETDFKFYDINNGILNKFKSEDYTEILKAGKEHIKAKVNSSELIDAAHAQLSILIEQITTDSGYKLDQPHEKKLLK